MDQNILFLLKGKLKISISAKSKSNFIKCYAKLFINQKFQIHLIKHLNHFKKFNNCVLVFIKDTNLKSVTQTLKDYKE